MSTRAAIISVTPVGCAGIYCHSDGYPAWTGRILSDFYRHPFKVAALMEGGSISFLGVRVNPTKAGHSFSNREPNVTVFYARDRGDEMRVQVGNTPEEVASMIDHDGHVYIYTQSKSLGGWVVIQ